MTLRHSFPIFYISALGQQTRLLGVNIEIRPIVFARGSAVIFESQLGYTDTFSMVVTD